jgi:hypothetical protein
MVRSGLPHSERNSYILLELRALTRQLMNKLKRIQARARELAQSGQFHGWSPIAFELRFEDGFEEGREWLYTATTRDELDRLCQAARASKNEAA